jgi:hypothetical protein
VRFVMPAGTYRCSAGRIVQTIPSADAQRVEVEVRVDMAAQGQADVVLSPTQGRAREQAATAPSLNPSSP